MTGVRDRTPVAYTNKKRGRDRSRPRHTLATQSLRYVLLVLAFGPDLDRLHVAARPLQPILAPYAGQNLRHHAQARGRDLLAALDAHAVLTLVQPLQCSRDAIHAVDQQLASREADLPALVGLDLVHLIGERPMLAARAE